MTYSDSTERAGFIDGFRGLADYPESNPGRGRFEGTDARMTYANAIERQALICGLRALADFLESNPDVPAPTYTDVLVFPPSAPDAEKQREIDVIASRIGSGTQTYSSCRHYQTSRRFGPVQYRAVAIPADENKEQ